jgi:hypothetical protein
MPETAPGFKEGARHMASREALTRLFGATWVQANHNSVRKSASSACS